MNKPYRNHILIFSLYFSIFFLDYLLSLEVKIHNKRKQTTAAQRALLFEPPLVGLTTQKAVRRVERFPLRE